MSFVVRNTGTREGHEVVQLYIRDVLASVARPVLELKGFDRVLLKPGASLRLEFPINAARHLAFRDANGRRVVEGGSIRIMVGSSSRDIRLRGFIEVRGSR